MANQESKVAECLEGSVNSISQFILDMFLKVGVDVDIETVKGVTVVVLAFTVAAVANFIFDKRG